MELDMIDLKNAVERMSNLPDSEKVNIKGKMYAQVATRVQIIREEFGQDVRIMSKIHEINDTVVRVESVISVNDRGEWVVIGNGFAEEYRAAGMINKNSALENCETSAIGRALANCGLSGGEYASSFEVNNAIHAKPIAPNLTTIGKSKNLKTNNTQINPASLMTEIAKYLRDPETKECQDYFQNRKLEIFYGRDHAQGQLLTRYQKLISLYGGEA
jgi:hypothetical protein